MFSLHPQLAKDCSLVADLTLCRLLLVNDSHYPWMILVPRREDIREAFELNEQDQHQLMRESNHLSALMAKHFQADKMNVAALGNLVPQLHIHHIVRYCSDAAWPGPIWGAKEAKIYNEQEKQALLLELKKMIETHPCVLIKA